MSTPVLIFPGIGNSGPQHWQPLWEEANPRFVRISQRDWDHPVCKEWVAILENTVKRLGLSVVIVAHSLACLAVAHWAAKQHSSIKGALLVAVPNPDSPNFPREAIGFAPLPTTPLSFPSTMVVSTNDHYSSLAYSETYAAAWVVAWQMLAMLDTLMPAVALASGLKVMNSCNSYAASISALVIG